MDNPIVSDEENQVPSLADFQGEHARMQALFELYQCGLMSLDLREARNGLDGLEYALSVHMEVEDEVLMPIFEALGDHGPGAGPELFKAEHNKMCKLLAGFFDDLQDLQALERAGALTRREALLVIERGFTFKHLFEHHTAREDKAFYPQITASLTPSEQRETRVRMDEREADARMRLGCAPTTAEIDF
jgi:hypothetical protein